MEFILHMSTSKEEFFSEAMSARPKAHAWQAAVWLKVVPPSGGEETLQSQAAQQSPSSSRRRIGEVLGRKLVGRFQEASACPTLLPPCPVHSGQQPGVVLEKEGAALVCKNRDLASSKVSAHAWRRISVCLVLLSFCWGELSACFWHTGRAGAARSLETCRKSVSCLFQLGRSSTSPGNFLCWE